MPSRPPGCRASPKARFFALRLYEQGTTPGEPLTTARTDGDGFVLDGVKPMVDQGLEAGLLVVPARLDNGSVGVFLAD